MAKRQGDIYEGWLCLNTSRTRKRMYLFVFDEPQLNELSGDWIACRLIQRCTLKAEYDLEFELPQPGEKVHCELDLTTLGAWK